MNLGRDGDIAGQNERLAKKAVRRTAPDVPTRPDCFRFLSVMTEAHHWILFGASLVLFRRGRFYSFGLGFYWQMNAQRASFGVGESCPSAKSLRGKGLRQVGRTDSIFGADTGGWETMRRPQPGRNQGRWGEGMMSPLIEKLRAQCGPKEKRAVRNRSMNCKCAQLLPGDYSTTTPLLFHVCFWFVKERALMNPGRGRWPRGLKLPCRRFLDSLCETRLRSCERNRESNR